MIAVWEQTEWQTETVAMYRTLGTKGIQLGVNVAVSLMGPPIVIEAGLFVPE